MRKFIPILTGSSFALRVLLVVMAALVLIPIAARPAVAACGTTNIALNKTVTASSTQSGLSVLAVVDGSAGTRWGSDWSDPQWIQIDLGSTQNVCRVKLSWEAAYGKSYTIQTSSDAVTWTTIYTATTGDGGVDDLTVTGTGRYIRMNGTIRATTYGYSLWEFEVYGGSSVTNTPTPTPTNIATSIPSNTPTKTPTATTIGSATPTTPPAGCGMTNIALNKTATSSSNENAGTTPNLAVDGNAGTRWSSAASDPQWLQIDLGSTQSICRVKLTWETAYGKSYTIQASNDAAAWTTIYTTTTGDAGVDNLTGLSGSGRYIRMNGIVRGTAWGYSLWEFEVYAGSGGPTITPSPTPTSTATATRTATLPSTATLGTPSSCGTTNIALNKTATSSSNENAGTTPNLAVDGNGGTRWSSAASDPQWIQVDLGSTQSICHVKLTWETAYAKSYTIQTSNDAAAWTTIYTTTTGDGGIDDLANLTGSGRYIRMNGTVRATAWGYSLWEFEIYTGSSSATNTPIPTLTTPPPTTPPPTTLPPTGCIGTGPAGTFPMCFVNNTDATWTDSQIYVTFLGQTTPGQWSYLRPDGTAVHINVADESAPGHLTKSGRNYANMSFTLAQAGGKFTIPTRWEGGRAYISLGSPMYIPISPDNGGWGGPDLNNPLDPNADVYYDWYEFTYFYGTIPYGGNTTQVDMFGFPMTTRLVQTSSGFDETRGVTLTRSQVMSQYTAAVGPAFDPLAGTYRIVAPRSSSSFKPGGSQANYMQAFIDEVWSFYSTNQFNLTEGNVVYSGGVVNGQLRFTRTPAAADGSGPFYINKPTTTDVFECSGALANGTMKTTELAVAAEMCAAFHRGVAINTANWANPSTYYLNSTHDDYSMFFHQISVANKAYGFAYDDVNNQSSVQILNNSNPPTSLTIAIGW